jgi:hypothetical protein
MHGSLSPRSGIARQEQRGYFFDAANAKTAIALGDRGLDRSFDVS